MLDFVDTVVWCLVKEILVQAFIVIYEIKENKVVQTRASGLQTLIYNILSVFSKEKRIFDPIA